MKNGSTILVIGSTGAMGTAVIKALLDDEKNQWKIRALTRYPRSYRAKALKELSSRVEIVEGNNNDISTIKDALEGVQGVFCNTDFWSSGKEAEIRQGKMIAEACKWARIEHFIYSSLDNCSQISQGKIPVDQFDAKAEVEAYITSRLKGGDAWFKAHTTVLVTLPYMEDFESFYTPKYINNEWVFKLPLKDSHWPMVSLQDIGWFATYIFANPSKTVGQILKIGSENLTMAEIVQQFSEITGQSTKYENISTEDFVAEGTNSKEVADMFRFFQEFEIQRDYEKLRQIHPDLLTFKKWLQVTNWRGEPREVQKVR